MWIQYAVVAAIFLLYDATYAVARPSRATMSNARSSVNAKNAVPNVGVRKNVITRAATKSAVSVNMPEHANLANVCKAQYTQCMDNFCNVLDDNQGRCSCSANLKNYAKTENALKEATENLQNVAQQIQYIGLSKDDIESLFTQTEAELKMSVSTDSSRLKNDLDRIKNMIVDVKSGTASVGDNSGVLDLSGLLDFSTSGTGFDLSSLFGNTVANTGRISNQRGEQLYKTAVARCKSSVLTTCSAQGVDISMISNSYDLEIDKQCIAYERRLADANSQMVSTIRNAKSVLQKARLMVAQQKNAYDLRGCVNALDSCMQDEFVCGTDYENCLDPTGKYIAKGGVIIGGKIGEMELSDDDIAGMLRTKIGKIDARGRVAGFCAPVMKKCQNYTMKNGKYDDNNALLAEYIARTSRIIKKNRIAKVNEYAATCLGDVVSCLNKNSSGVFSDYAINSCRSVITTCKSITDGAVDSNVKKWLQEVLGLSYSQATEQPPSGQEQPTPGQENPPAPNLPTGAEIAQMQEEDIANCLSIENARISKSGAMCVLWGLDENETEDDLLARAKQAVDKYGGIVAFKLNNKRGYSETVAKFPTVNVRMYVMRFAYYRIKAECEIFEGEFNYELGKVYEWPMCRNVPVRDEGECQSIGYANFENVPSIPWSIGPSHSAYSFDPETGVCNVRLGGLWYSAADVPGECQSNYSQDPKDSSECIPTMCLDGNEISSSYPPDYCDTLR